MPLEWFLCENFPSGGFGGLEAVPYDLSNSERAMDGRNPLLKNQNRFLYPNLDMEMFFAQTRGVRIGVVWGGGWWYLASVEYRRDTSSPPPRDLCSKT